MASLFDSASLVMLPSGVKNEKLYSIKPTNGSGDFTFSRDGLGGDLWATRVNASGLIEKGRTNEVLQSNTFDNASWSSVSTTETSGQADKDGGTNAWLIDKTASQFASIRQTFSGSGVQTLSVYAKAGTLDYLIVYASSAVNPKAWFNLSTGAVGTTQGSLIDSNIEDLGSGWYRCSITFNDTITDVRIYPNDTDGTFGSASGDVIIMNAMLEQSMVPTDYIETTTAAVSAGLLGDMPRLDYSGGASCPSLLLEPSRVNLFPYSEYYNTDWINGNVTIVDNDSVSPEGVQNAANLYPTTTGTTRYIYDTIAASSDRYTISAYVKANGLNVAWLYMQSISSVGIVYFDLSDETIQEVDGSGNTITGNIEDAGNGWYRISATVGTALALTSGSGIGVSDAKGSLSVTANGTDGILVYGLQLEAGSYPTSYIPSYGSASTRGADSATTSYSNLISTQSFTLFAEHTPIGGGFSGSTAAYTLDISGSSDNIELYVNNGGATDGLNVYLGSGNGGYIFGTSVNSGWVKGSKSKVALSYDGNNLKYYINGVLYNSASAVSFVNANTLLSLRHAKGNALNQALLFPSALTDAECINLTTL